MYAPLLVHFEDIRAGDVLWPGGLLIGIARRMGDIIGCGRISNRATTKQVHQCSLVEAVCTWRFGDQKVMTRY